MYEASYLLKKLEVLCVTSAVLVLIQVVDHSEPMVLVDYFVVETTDVTLSRLLHCSSQAVTTAHTLLYYI